MDIKIWDGGYFYSFVGKYYPQLDYKTEFEQPTDPIGTDPNLPILDFKERILLVAPDVKTGDIMKFSSTRILLSKCRKKYNVVEQVHIVHEYFYPFNKIIAKLPLYMRYCYIFGDKNQVLEEYKDILKRSYQKTLSQQVVKTTVLEAIKSTIEEYSKVGTRLVIISAERDQKHSFKSVLVNSLRENGIIVEKLWD